ncbi:MAG: hypothetical protein CMO36_04185 [Verrucomicrobiaceae bacterium]|mgnify:CR=1 FL=1|nr:hypothetical protein [Verrucomicrobiaceae bacterium]|tara:strand:- start:550 stop:768 length:219 start_codon:yes stop_codon:yes gene_type:complete
MSDYNFQQGFPEKFESLFFAQCAINENPLPFKTMKYEIERSVYGGYVVNTYLIKEPAPVWIGFLNRKRRESV